ncbi:MAG: bile acid:sodium symporter family protein [Bacteroidales bacterium]
MLESLKVLDELRLNFSQSGLFILNLTLAFIMFGVALEIKLEHFKKVILNPVSTLVGVFSQFFLLPLVTFLITILLRHYITPTIALGMILVASCPGGNISNFMSSLARGNVALSVSLTAIATLSAIFMTPLNFSLWGGLFTEIYSRTDASGLVRPLEIDVMQMFQTVFILLGIPLVLGMWFNHRFPDLTKKIVVPIKRLSVVFFMGMVVMAFMNNFDYFKAHIKYIFLLVLIHNTVALTTGYSIASLFRRNATDRKTISIETGIQNSGLGLVLLFNPKIFPPDLAIGGMAFITAWWGIWHILSGLGIAGLWGRRRKRVVAIQ